MFIRACLAALGLWLAAPSLAEAPARPEIKVLRYAMRAAETGFDPAQLSDLYSSIMAANIFDAPYRYDYLARPIRAVPNTAAALPEVSADFTTYTVHLRPGIYFAEDPAFRGQRRELVADDYVYSIKRLFDPHWKSPSYLVYAANEFIGMEALRRAALETGKPFDYDQPIEGLRALDRYTLRIHLASPNPRFLDVLTDPARVGAVAREVVAFYGDKIMEHPVGTGPFKLSDWRRSSLVAFDRNPGFRDEFYAETPPADNPRLVAAAARLKGRKLPLVDRVEVSIIEEEQPRWLAFLNREMDLIEQVPEGFIDLAAPNGALAPNLAKQGVYQVRTQRNDSSMSYFAMENPVVGGYTPEKVALRRAIALAVDVGEEIRSVRHGQAIPAQGLIPPGLTGYDPAFRSEMSEFSRAKAQALLDLYGYVDRDGDGWREQPDGSPLVLEYATQPTQLDRQLITQWKKNMDAIGVRIVFKPAQWPANLKASRAGKLMMWGVAWSDGPDGQKFLDLGSGADKGQANHARFANAEYDALFARQKVLPDGPERTRLMTRMQEILIAYMPYKVHVHRIWTDLAQPWLVGYQRNIFLREFWRYVDIDLAEKSHRLSN